MHIVESTDNVKTESITGRDDLIIEKALAYAIIAIGRLPFRWQEWSDGQDMRVLLDFLAGESAKHFLRQANYHLTRGRVVAETTLP